MLTTAIISISASLLVGGEMPTVSYHESTLPVSLVQSIEIEDTAEESKDTFTFLSKEGDIIIAGRCPALRGCRRDGNGVCVCPDDIGEMQECGQQILLALSGQEEMLSFDNVNLTRSSLMFPDVMA